MISDLNSDLVSYVGIFTICFAVSVFLFAVLFFIIRAVDTIEKVRYLEEELNEIKKKLKK